MDMGTKLQKREKENKDNLKGDNMFHSQSLPLATFHTASTHRWTHKQTKMSSVARKQRCLEGGGER